jgi:hypothetical protein
MTTNTEMLANVMALLENIKLNDELDNHNDFKKLMSKVTTAAMKGSNKVVVKQTKTSNPYTDFVKAKMPELKDTPKGEKFKLIGEMWQAHKAANPEEPKAPNVAKAPKAPKAPKVAKVAKAPKAPKAPKVAKVAKEPKAPKAPKVAKVAKVADNASDKED